MTSIKSNCETTGWTPKPSFFPILWVYTSWSKLCGATIIEVPLIFALSFLAAQWSCSAVASQRSHWRTTYRNSVYYQRWVLLEAVPSIINISSIFTELCRHMAHRSTPWWQVKVFVVTRCTIKMLPFSLPTLQPVPDDRGGKLVAVWN